MAPDFSGDPMLFSLNSRREMLLHFLWKYNLATLSKVILLLNEHASQLEVARSIHCDPGQFSRFAGACLERTWTVKADLQRIVDVVVDDTNADAENVKGRLRVVNVREKRAQRYINNYSGGKE